ncbi:hypothetical protein D3C76_940600 [compost metagenome]
MDFLIGLRFPENSIILQGNCNFDKLLKSAGIVAIKDIESNRHSARSLLIKEDGSFYEYRFGSNFLSDISLDWESFTSLQIDSRQVIFDALYDERRIGPSVLRYRRDTIDKYFNESDIEEVNFNNVITSVETA